MKITYEAGASEAWVCQCGNSPTSDGFFPCDEMGQEMEPVAGWRDLYVCNRCGAIIAQVTLEVIGYRVASGSEMVSGHEG